MDMKKPLHERVGISIIVAMVLYILVLLGPQILMGSLGVTEPAVSLLNLVMYSAFWFGFVPLILRLPDGQRSLRQYLAAIRLSQIRPLGRQLLWGLGAGGLLIASYAGLTLFSGHFDPDLYSILPPASWILLYGVIGALFEEVAMRGVVLVQMLKAFKSRRAILMSAAIFGAGHILTVFLGDDLLWSSVRVLNAFILGILFGYLFVRSNSLIPGVIAHVIINAFTGVFLAPVFEPGVSLMTRSLIVLSGSGLTTLSGVYWLGRSRGIKGIASLSFAQLIGGRLSRKA